MASGLSNPNAVEEDHYFSSNDPPKNLDQITSSSRDFINFHANANRRVALVTSGGTTVPLEKQTVRFSMSTIQNQSTWVLPEGDCNH